MTTSVIELSGVGKRYIKYVDAPMLTTALVRFRRGTKRDELWAVRDVDFQVGEGECVGVIGRNGSGKSTLLQMLSGITAPTTGRVIVRGRIAPLISVGVGFHPELTGRDNVYVNGTILGLTRQEINRRFDQIVEFAELADFIDTPVKFYSSGMAVRLGFSVAIQADPEVLVVDEVLAVGDFAFQLKCFERITALRNSGKTILVVSHNLSAIRQMCDRTMLMNQGEKVFEGDTAEAISNFHELMEEVRELEGPVDGARKVPFEAGYAELVEATAKNAEGKASHHFEAGEKMLLSTRLRALQDITNPYLGIIITNQAGIVVYNDTNRLAPFASVRAGRTRTFEAALPSSLPTGSYSVQLIVGHIPTENQPVRILRDVLLNLYIAGRPYVHGAADLGARFTSRPARG
ncbi:MAG: ABC transporter ATP-binding protein [Actinomycetes bacterium]